MLYEMLTPQTTQSETRRPLRVAKFAKGQIAVVLTLVAVTLAGAMALGTDVAVLYFNWVELQKAADAAALAGASYLPNDTATAKSTAITFAKNNGITAAEISTPTISNSNTQITVNIQRNVPYYFATLHGLTTGQVKVASTASLPGGPSTIGGPILVGTGGTGGGTSTSTSGTPVSPTCG